MKTLGTGAAEGRHVATANLLEIYHQIHQKAAELAVQEVAADILMQHRHHLDHGYAGVDRFQECQQDVIRAAQGLADGTAIASDAHRAMLLVYYGLGMYFAKLPLWEKKRLNLPLACFISCWRMNYPLYRSSLFGAPEGRETVGREANRFLQRGQFLGKPVPTWEEDSATGLEVRGYFGVYDVIGRDYTPEELASPYYDEWVNPPPPG
jgi:hypothetical protein